MVARFDHESHNGESVMVACPTGGFVPYDQYFCAVASAESEIAKLQRKLDEIERVLLGGR